SSLALPQGNPANLAVTGAAGVEAGTFVSHLLVPALTATLVLAASIGFVERRALSAGCVTAPRSPAGFSRGELGAALALAAAAATSATSSWLPVPAWLPIPLVAGERSSSVVRAARGCRCRHPVAARRRDRGARRRRPGSRAR